MALFDAFASRDNSSRNETTVIQDSYNSSSSSTNVYDSIGNTSVTINPDAPVKWDKILPVLAIVMVLGAVGWVMVRHR